LFDLICDLDEIVSRSLSIRLDNIPVVGVSIPFVACHGSVANHGISLAIRCHGLVLEIDSWIIPGLGLVIFESVLRPLLELCFLRLEPVLELHPVLDPIDYDDSSPYFDCLLVFCRARIEVIHAILEHGRVCPRDHCEEFVCLYRIPADVLIAGLFPTFQFPGCRVDLVAHRLGLGTRRGPSCPATNAVSMSI
jgi:hypothetical protein